MKLANWDQEGLAQATEILSREDARFHPATLLDRAKFEA